jgi:hypothetical protein
VLKTVIPRQLPHGPQERGHLEALSIVSFKGGVSGNFVNCKEGSSVLDITFPLIRYLMFDKKDVALYEHK